MNKKLILELKISDAISRRNAAIASANQELNQGGWLCNWQISFNQIDQELYSLFEEIKKT